MLKQIKRVAENPCFPTGEQSRFNDFRKRVSVIVCVVDIFDTKYNSHLLCNDL